MYRRFGDGVRIQQLVVYHEIDGLFSYMTWRSQLWIPVCTLYPANSDLEIPLGGFLFADSSLRMNLDLCRFVAAAFQMSVCGFRFPDADPFSNFNHAATALRF